MKHIELICELMLAAHTGDVTNKEAALDRAMDQNSLRGKSVAKCAAGTILCLRRIERMFPRLKTTRFAHAADFYTLAVLVLKFESERLILTDRKRNTLAWNLIQIFSNGVDDIRHRQKTMQLIAEGQAIYREYAQTVQEGTDEVTNRRNRERILRALLEALFARKDKARVFSREQRRIIWNSTAERRCTVKTCNKLLTWDDFTVDHIDPYSKGGRTELKNAVLLRRRCNSSLGNRRNPYLKAMAA
jgi:5-methylcytosine-specific restriction endonuclease McrA